jgi:hypothetical protein
MADDVQNPLVVTSGDFHAVTAISIKAEIDCILSQSNTGIKIDLLAQMLSKVIFLLATLNEKSEDRDKELKDKLDSTKALSKIDFETVTDSMNNLSQQMLDLGNNLSKQMSDLNTNLSRQTSDLGSHLAKELRNSQTEMREKIAVLQKAAG